MPFSHSREQRCTLANVAGIQGSSLALPPSQFTLPRVSYPVKAQSSCVWSAENCPGPPVPPWVEADIVEDLLVVCLPCLCSLHSHFTSCSSSLPPLALFLAPFSLLLLNLSAFFLVLCFEVCLSWTALAPGISIAHPFLSFRFSLSHLCDRLTTTLHGNR